jgi:hypothetical protein
MDATENLSFLMLSICEYALTLHARTTTTKTRGGVGLDAFARFLWAKKSPILTTLCGQLMGLRALRLGGAGISLN